MMNRSVVLSKGSFRIKFGTFRQPVTEFKTAMLAEGRRHVSCFDVQILISQKHIKIASVLPQH
jgi:hypothetical protein